MPEVPQHRGKVIQYIVGMGANSHVELAGLPTENYQNRFALPNSDADRKYIHDCILVAIANNLDLLVRYNDARTIEYIRLYPA